MLRGDCRGYDDGHDFGDGCGEFGCGYGDAGCAEVCEGRMS